MKKVIKNLIRFILLGSFSMILAACYGVYMRYGKRIIVKNTDKDGIANLLVRVDNGRGAILIEQRTGTDGTVYLDSPIPFASLQANIIDTDGNENNGNHIETNIELDDAAEQLVIIERKE